MEKTWFQFSPPHRRGGHAMKGILALFLLLSLACRATQSHLEPSSPPQSPTAEPTIPLEEFRTTFPSTVPTDQREQPPIPNTCSFSTVTAKILEGTSSERWLDWIEKLSGAEPVNIAGENITITSRYSPAMFNGHPNARAFEFVLETVLAWYPLEQVESLPYTIHDPEGSTDTWYNLRITLPGISRPHETVIISAHLDSTSNENPAQTAPGAEDNGSGSAALLEAARLLREYRFERTIQIIWFTGEEQGLLGSTAYVNELADPETVMGVINLDMFGYDSDDDACFEIHAGTLPASAIVGQCFVQSIDTYDIGLNRYDYLTDNAIDLSDHGSFWEAKIGAIEILENLFDQDLPQGCPNGDPNSSYHTPNDTVEKINPTTGIAIVRAALATVADLAVPIE